MRSSWDEYTGRTPHEVRETFPKACPNGHALKPGTVLLHGDSVWRLVLCRVCGAQYERQHTEDKWTVTQQYGDA